MPWVHGNFQTTERSSKGSGRQVAGISNLAIHPSVRKMFIPRDGSSDRIKFCSTTNGLLVRKNLCGFGSRSKISEIRYYSTIPLRTQDCVWGVFRWIY